MKKGFTLIELLAVIVILAIIALIAVPIVLNIINDSKESSLLRSAEFYLDAVEYTIADAFLYHGGLDDGTYPITPEGDICKENETPCSESNILKVEVSGEKPTSGTITINKGTISGVLFVLDSKTIITNLDGELVYNDKNIICKAVETATTGTIPSSTNGYVPGDEYMCLVGKNQEYRFFVLSTEGNKVNLILEANISEDGKPVTTNDQTAARTAWASNEDYYKDVGGIPPEKANDEGKCEYGGYCSLDDKGPITAIKKLNEITSSWTNLINLNEIYNDYFGKYTNFPLTGKARFPKFSELYAEGVCIDTANPGTCPLWVTNYMSYLSEYYQGSAIIIDSESYIAMDASRSDENDYVTEMAPAGTVVTGSSRASGIYNIRPVITILKTQIQD